MITEKNLIKHELIGLEAEVIEGNSKGVKGKVVNETKNMICLKTKKGAKKIQKKNSVFVFMLPNGKKIKVNGKLIEKRPEDRIKTKVRKW